MKKNKPHLPVDLMIVNTLDHNIAQKTLAYCARFFEFNNIIMISDTKINYENYISIKIDRFKNLHEYNESYYVPEMLKKAVSLNILGNKNKKLFTI